MPARAAGMSIRTYLLHFVQATGNTPVHWLISQRVQGSPPLLEKTRTPIEEIANAVGFDTAVTYRHHFNRFTRTSRSAYRKAFTRRDAP
ncbi:helix-turn-helix domain-containing protein [Streptomyces sioyaensis]|uniref:helix-turn-helix domain-containing protein n=1 Tax=Streptomyces sioyaensis TaxID=67364 RepID=UPI001C2BF972|nr:helix-turn-helix domain-containing protein [Streptomyces sioyaensis]